MLGFGLGRLTERLNPHPDSLLARGLCESRRWLPGRPLTRRWGQRRPLPQERALRNLRVGARKTPHLLLAKTPEFSSPLGEGEAARPFEEIDTGRPSLGLGKGLPGEARGRALEEAGVLPRSLERRRSDAALTSSTPYGIARAAWTQKKDKASFRSFAVCQTQSLFREGKA